MQAQCGGGEKFPVPLTGVRFGLMASEDIMKLSVQETLKPAQVTDSSLGLPLAEGAYCTYCGTVNATDCPGHFGHVKLVSPVYHPSHIRKLCELLNKVCLRCGKLRNSKKKKIIEDDAFLEQQITSVAAASTSAARNLKRELNDNYILISDDEGEDFLIDIHAIENPDDKKKLLKARNSVCKFCKGAYKYPEVKIALLRVAETRTGCVETIRLRCPGRDLVPEGYWPSLNIESGKSSLHKIDLHPTQAKMILSRISMKTMKILRMDVRAEAFIIENFPVPPNCTQSSDTMDFEVDSIAGARIGILKSLVRKNGELARAKAKNSRAVAIEAKSLQLSISNYLRLKGCRKVRGNLEPVIRKGAMNAQPPRYAAIWRTRLKGSVLGKMTQYCALGVLTGDPNIGVEEILVPEEIASQITIPERATIHNYEKLRSLVNNVETGFIERHGSMLDLRDSSFRKLELGDTLHRPLQPGDYLYANRTPSLHKHSLIAFRIQIHSGKTIRINPLVCRPFQADFDGDRMHLFFPQAPDVIAECSELMGLSKQLIDSQNGDFVVTLTQDTLLAAYTLVSGRNFYSRAETSHLAAQVEKTLPPPAVFKSSSKAPLWTGFQVFSLLLPSEMNFSFEGVVISGGELLQTGESSGWLKNSSRSLLHAIYRNLGFAAAAGYLDTCSVLLKELLLVDGFSVSLEDFRLAAADAALEERIAGVLEKTKGCASLARLQDAQADVDQLIKSSVSPRNSLGSMMMSGSKGNVSSIRKHIACLGVQLHRRDEPVPGFSPFIARSFWEGLNTSEFFHHSVCSRDLLTKQLHLSDAGVLGDMLMKHLADVYYAYDGTVRQRCQQQVICFESGEFGRIDPGEPVGILAAIAIKKQAYEAVLSAPNNPSKYLEMMKQALQPRSKDLKEMDRALILRLKTCRAEGEGCHCKIKRLLKLRHRLQNVTMEKLTQKLVIEWTKEDEFSWLCHFHLIPEEVDRLDVLPESIPRYLNKVFRNIFPTLTHRCTLSPGCENAGGLCIHLEVGSREDELANSLKHLKDFIIPELLVTSITGNGSIESVRIFWEDKDDLFAINPGEKGDGEPVLEVVMKKESNNSGAFSMLQKACGEDLIDVVDWLRSAPCGVQLMLNTFGIEATRECIYQRLQRVMKKLDVTVDPVHLALVSEFCTHTGTVLGYTPTGFDSFLNAVKASAPFLQATLRFPVKNFENAAHSGRLDPLEDTVSATAWGKRSKMGTGTSFELLWSEKKAEDETFDLWTTLDIHDYLGSVREDVRKTPATPAIMEDRNIEAMSTDQTGTSGDFGWNTGADPVEGQDNGWGDSAMETEAGGGGWGATTENQNSGWGATESRAAENEGGWGDEKQASGDDGDWGEKSTPALNESTPADFGWGATPMQGVEQNSWDDRVEEPERDNSAALAANEAAFRERLEQLKKSSEEPPVAVIGGFDELEEAPAKFRKAFAPSGSNAIPVAARGFARKFKWAPPEPEKNERAAEPTPMDSDAADAGGDQAMVPSGGDDAWGNSADAGEKNDGWGSAANAGESDANAATSGDAGGDDGDGWGNPAANPAAGAKDEGWGTPAAGAEEQRAAGEAPGDGGFATVVTSFKRPARSGKQSAPTRPVDPVRKRFNEEIYTLVQSVRETLTRYGKGDHLSEEDELEIVDNVLVHHPNYESKVGPGIDYLKVDEPVDHPGNMCFFVVRKDGSEEDFSYHKCLKNLVEQSFGPEYFRLYDLLFLKKKDQEVAP